MSDVLPPPPTHQNQVLFAKVRQPLETLDLTNYTIKQNNFNVKEVEQDVRPQPLADKTQGADCRDKIKKGHLKPFKILQINKE